MAFICLPIRGRNGLHLVGNLRPKWSYSCPKWFSFACQFAAEIVFIFVPISAKMVFFYVPICARKLSLFASQFVPEMVQMAIGLKPIYLQSMWTTVPFVKQLPVLNKRKNSVWMITGFCFPIWTPSLVPHQLTIFPKFSKIFPRIIHSFLL